MSGDTTCPVCERDGFASNRGMRQHASLKHDVNLTKESEQCKNCGEMFDYHPSDRENPQFCGNECQHQYNRNRATLICDECGEEYEKPKSRVERSSYCSELCQNKGMKEVEVRACTECGSDVARIPSNFNSVVFCDHECWGDYLESSDNHICVECGDTFSDSPSRTRVCCSVDCADSYKSGENSPLWAGGSDSHYYYGENWNKMKAKALERANYTCEHSDCENDREHLGQNPDVHHIIPHRVGVREGYFDTREEANNMSNLLVLCREHHAEVEPPAVTKVSV